MWTCYECFRCKELLFYFFSKSIKLLINLLESQLPHLHNTIEVTILSLLSQIKSDNTCENDLSMPKLLVKYRATLPSSDLWEMDLIDLYFPGHC
jgi:hypothetical protein